MKNFLRALRYSWPYRLRLTVSLVCALIAAVLWGLTFTSISPTLGILVNKQNLQEWTRSEITKDSDAIKQLNARHDQLQKEAEAAEHLPVGSAKEKLIRDKTHDIARVEKELQALNRQMWFYQVAEMYCTRYLPTDPFQTMGCLVVLVVIGVLVRGFFEFWQESLVGSVVNLSLYDLRNRLYRKVIHLDVGNFSEDGTHELLAKFTNDMETLGNGTKTLFGKVVAEPLKALVCVGIACWTCWQLTLMFLILVPVAVFVLTKVGRLMKRATRRLLENMANLYKILQEAFLGIRVVKAFTMEPYERRRFRTAAKEYCRRAVWVVNLDALASPIIEFLGVMAVGAAFLVGAYLVLNDETKMFGIRLTDRKLDYQSLFFLYFLLASIADPVRKLSSVYTRMQSGAAAADRIFAFIDRQPRVTANTAAPRLPRHAAAIEFRDVCFSYEPGRPILTNVHLKVRFGETIALVGRNGCGKTTLVGLIPRFYDPDHGFILIDGTDIRTVNLRSLRQQVGVVTQDTTLFDDTIANNITYGSHRVRPEEIEDAAVRAYAHDFIVKMPHGYQTRIGEAGAKLSGGQRQRLALARAILRNPHILILDEFTSQSDVESEALVHKALRDFMRNRTTFVITHRLHTLEIADRIVMVDSGRIAAAGTHQELLKTCPEYLRLHEAHMQRLCA